jgi:soluble lytic murein transglycosylase-like protein
MKKASIDEYREPPENPPAPKDWFVFRDRRVEFLGAAEQYVKEWPHGPAASKTLFWLAKCHEEDDAGKAVRYYQRLIARYPYDYYAFRSQGRLAVLVEGRPDPAWATFVERNYPPPKDDWAAQASGRRDQGIRIIRDALERRTLEAFSEAAHGRPFQAPGTLDELKLLYPMYYAGEIRDASRRFGLDPFLIQALIREESHFNELAVSPDDARGLMQLLPSTAEEVAGWERLRGFRVNDLFVPEISIRMGTRYLRYLHDLFGGSSLAAVGGYHGGPGSMRDCIHNSPHFTDDPDMFIETAPRERTRRYIRKVFGSYWNYLRLYCTEDFPCEPVAVRNPLAVD